MYILLFYQYLSDHHYIILNIETDHHNLRESIIAGCFCSSCIWVLIFYMYTKDSIFNKMGHHILPIIETNIRSFSIFNDTIRLFITTLKLRGEMTSWSSSSSST